MSCQLLKYFASANCQQSGFLTPRKEKEVCIITKVRSWAENLFVKTRRHTKVWKSNSWVWVSIIDKECRMTPRNVYQRFKYPIKLKGCIPRKNYCKHTLKKDQWYMDLTTMQKQTAVSSYLNTSAGAKKFGPNTLLKTVRKRATEQGTEIPQLQTSKNNHLRSPTSQKLHSRATPLSCHCPKSI